MHTCRLCTSQLDTHTPTLIPTLIPTHSTQHSHAPTHKPPAAGRCPTCGPTQGTVDAIAWDNAVETASAVDGVAVIFLDIDGVLNQNSPASQNNIDKALADRYCTLLDATKAYTILSSTWRLHPGRRNEVKKMLETRGHVMMGDTAVPELNSWAATIPYGPGVIKQIKVMRSVQRAAEILSWVDARAREGVVLRWIALDDLPLGEVTNTQVATIREGHVHIDGNIGLTTADVDAATSLLSKSLA